MFQFRSKVGKGGSEAVAGDGDSQVSPAVFPNLDCVGSAILKKEAILAGDGVQAATIKKISNQAHQVFVEMPGSMSADPGAGADADDAKPNDVEPVVTSEKPASNSDAALNVAGREKATKPDASVCAAGDSAAYHRTSVYGDDVFIVAAYRTALCKSKRGGFKDTYPDDLLAPVLKAVIEKTNLNPAEVGDIVVGTFHTFILIHFSHILNVHLSETVPLRTVNRQCSSGLQAVADVAAAIKAGFYDLFVET
ncbi:acetyl-CoA C-acyltransferase [Sarracenia purpurea var. burkii]